jgi:hypothetical protein
LIDGVGALTVRVPVSAFVCVVHAAAQIVSDACFARIIQKIAIEGAKGDTGQGNTDQADHETPRVIFSGWSIARSHCDRRSRHLSSDQRALRRHSPTALTYSRRARDAGAAADGGFETAQCPFEPKSPLDNTQFVVRDHHVLAVGGSRDKPFIVGTKLVALSPLDL